MDDLDYASILCRAERPGEESVVRAVVQDAFGEGVIGQLVDRLRESPDWIDGLSFVAEHIGRVIGHILLTRSLLDAPRRLVDMLVLSPVSVAPAWQGQGIGSKLVRYGLAQVAQRSEPLVFLEGSPQYYGRFGFQPAGQHGFRRPSLRIPAAAFQVWDLDCVRLRDMPA